MPNTYEPPKTNEVTPAASAGIPAARPRQGYGLAVLVFLLLAFIGLGLGWMHQQQRHHGQQLAADISELAAANQHSNAQLKTLQARLTAAEQALSTVASAQQGDRRQLQMTLAEHLLLTANERLQLAHDGPGAQLALELADARLALLNDPRLTPLRESIARERAALAQLPRTDRSGALISLAALIEAAPNLPLAARVPERFEATPETPSETPTTPAVNPPPGADGWWSGAWAQVRHALNAMFSVRRARGPAPRLLSPEQEQQVQQILQLRLEAVRVTLLRSEQPALREAALSAVRWLRQYFHGEDPGVQSALSELQRIGALPLDGPLPDISASLSLLRAELARGKP